MRPYSENSGRSSAVCEAYLQINKVDLDHAITVSFTRLPSSGETAVRGLSGMGPATLVDSKRVGGSKTRPNALLQARARLKDTERMLFVIVQPLMRFLSSYYASSCSLAFFIQAGKATPFPEKTLGV
jgi:hypothetical protein